MKTQTKTIRNTNCDSAEQYRLFKKSKAYRRRFNKANKTKYETNVIKALTSKAYHCGENNRLQVSHRLVSHQKKFARDVGKQLFNKLLETIEGRSFPNFEARELFVKQFFSNAGFSSKEIKRLQKEYREYFCNQVFDKAISYCVTPILSVKPVSNFQAIHVDISNLEAQLQSAGLPKSELDSIFFEP